MRLCLTHLKHRLKKSLIVECVSHQTPDCPASRKLRIQSVCDIVPLAGIGESNEMAQEGNGIEDCATMYDCPVGLGIG